MSSFFEITYGDLVESVSRLERHAVVGTLRPVLDGGFWFALSMRFAASVFRGDSPSVCFSETSGIVGLGGV